MVITLKWAIYYMCVNPDAQMRVQAEIDAAMERSRLPALEDKINLPFLEACLFEVHRLACVSYVTLPRVAEKDIVMGGYDIPQGTSVYFSFGSMLRDPKNFECPQEFRPDRFLSADGSKFVPDHKMVHFGQGKRNCLGQNISQKSLFLFLAGLLQNFSFHLADKTPRNLGLKHGLIAFCPEYEFVCDVR
jgi:cytochrome P450